MDKVIVGMEPTGHYWLNLAHFLKDLNIKFVVVNPMHVKKSKELEITGWIMSYDKTRKFYVGTI